MKNAKYLVLSILLTLFLNSASFSQMHDRGSRDGMRDMMIKKLQLTPEQEKKISDLRLQHQSRLIDLNAELKKQELQKEKLLSGDVIDRNDMLNNAKEIGEIRNQIAAERINHQMDVYENLDANQKQIWKDMMLKGGKMKMRMKNDMKDKMQDRMMNREKMQ